MVATKATPYSRLAALHRRSVELAQLYAICMQGPDSKARLLKSLLVHEGKFQKALKRALR